MTEIAVGIFAILVGALFCFSGYKVMRILFPLWGLVAGYWAGAALVAAITGDGFLGTTMGIVVGVVFALIGALCAYLYYGISVLIFMGATGFWLGAGIITLLGFEPGIISSIVGISFGIAFVLAGLVINAPKTFLLFITAFAGAALSVAGALVLINVASLESLQDGAFAVISDHGIFWKLVVLGLGTTGLSSQLVGSSKEELQWQAEWKKATVNNG